MLHCFILPAPRVCSTSVVRLTPTVRRPAKSQLGGQGGSGRAQGAAGVLCGPNGRERREAGENSAGKVAPRGSQRGLEGTQRGMPKAHGLGSANDAELGPDRNSPSALCSRQQTVQRVYRRASRALGHWRYVDTLASSTGPPSAHCPLPTVTVPLPVPCSLSSPFLSGTKLAECLAEVLSRANRLQAIIRHRDEVHSNLPGALLWRAVESRRLSLGLCSGLVPGP